MKLRLKEEPKEWRKNAWLTLVGLAVVSTILHWRRVLSGTTWLGIVSVCVVAAVLAGAKPGLFRGYYRFSMRLGFALSQMAGKVVLALFFIIVITPLGIVLRCFGKDPLRLRRPGKESSCWSEVKKSTSLDQMY
jgi:hypothetical protein